MPIFVIMHDATQTVCPVEAKSADEARAMIAEKLGRDVSAEPIYCTDSDEDMRAIMAILAGRKD